jgi:hypothetical protein
MFVDPYILVTYMFNSSPTRCTIFFISFLTKLALHVSGAICTPSSETQLQSTAIGFVSVENRGFSIKWCGGLFYMDLCVLVFHSLM